MARIAIVLLLLLVATDTVAVTFNRVVDLGDSLFDAQPERAPVAPQHIARRLGVPYATVAEGGATSASLLAEGQHTRVAADFGAGDLAVLWIGGNDFLANINGASGDEFLNELEANVDLILATLHDAGLAVLTFNLPDMSRLPGTLFLDADQATRVRSWSLDWRDRLDALGARYGTVVVDVFTLFEALEADAAAFAFDGGAPLLAPDQGFVEQCAFCVWADEIHPSALGQGLVANAAFVALNARFDPAGAAPLETLDAIELRSLTTYAPLLRASGLWFDPATNGTGFDVIESEAGTTVYYYGADAAGNPLWLISETLPGRFALGMPRSLTMNTVSETAFGAGGMTPTVSTWGSLEITLDGCGSGRFVLDGLEGRLEQQAQRLATTDAVRCSAVGPTTP